MAIVIGGNERGLLDSSLLLLDRSDRTGAGDPGGGEQIYVNVSNGNLVIQHTDAFLPSLGEDYALVRTYNARGRLSDAHGHDDAGWSLSTSVRLDVRHGSGGTTTFEVEYGDGSVFDYRLDEATGLYVSTDGAGAFETIEDLGVVGTNVPAYLLTRADGSVLAFDRQGRLLSATDPNGVGTRFVYQADRLIRVVDDIGHRIDYVYQNGVLARVVDEREGVLVRYVYQGGRLVEVIDRFGHSTKYEYTSQGQLSRVVLPSRQVVDGKLEIFASRGISIEYAPVGSQQDTRAPSPAVTRIVDAEGGITTFEYDFDVASPGQNARIQRGRPPERKNAAPPGQPGSGEDKFSNGGVTRVVDALGNARAFSNEQPYVDWRVANGFYARYDASRAACDASIQAQVDLIRHQHALTYSYQENGYITEVVDPQGFKTRYAYDASSNLTAVTDRNGWGVTHSDSSYYRELRKDLGFVDSAGLGKRVAELTPPELGDLLALFTSHFTYDERGNLLTSADNEGHVTRFTYTDFNQLASSTSAQGHTTTFAYDAHQNLIRQVDPGGDVTLFEYDSYGNQTRRIVLLDPSVTDPDDPANADRVQVTRFFYDAFGNNVRSVDAEGAETRSEFDHFGNLVRFTDARGGVTLFRYDADNRLLSTTDPEGHTTAYAYDAVGNRIRITDASGHGVLQLFDRNNRLVATLDPSADGSADRLTRSSYDVVGNETARTDAEGRTTTFVYDARRQLVETITEEVAGPDATTPTRYSTTYAYDGEGNRIRTTNARGFTTELLYTPDGLLRRTTDASGQVTQIRYDANHNQIEIVAGLQLPISARQIRRFAYDEEDQLVRATDALGHDVLSAYDAPGNVVAITDENGHATDFEYDRNNRLLREIRPEVTDPDSGGPVRYVLEHRYDANGNETETVDEHGHSTRFAFDRDDKLVLVTDANGVQTVFGYDSRENTTSVRINVEAFVDADGKVVVTNDAEARTTSFVYDEFNQLVTMLDALGNTSHTAYDRVGNQIASVDALGRTTRFEFDALDRLVARTDAVGTAQERISRFRYDGNGNQVASIDALGRVTSFAYDAVDRLSTQTDPLGTVELREYDAFGNQIRETLARGTPDERITVWTYDLENRTTGIRDPEGRTRHFEYDPVGNRRKETDERGGVNEFAYDATNRLIARSDPLGGVRRITYDASGNTTETDESGRATKSLFDADHRLVGQVDPGGDARSFGYDAFGNTIRETDENGHTTTFAYDALDRVVSRTSAVGHELAASATTEAERLAILAAHTRSFRYDGVGNQVAAIDENGNTFLSEYDALDRVTKQLSAEGFLSSFEYDAAGNELVRNDYRQRYAPNADGSIPEPSFSDVPRRTVSAYDANDRLTSLVDPVGRRTEFQYDALGNVTAKVEGAASVGLLSAAAPAAPGPSETRRHYDKSDLLIEETDALGVVTRFELDEAGNVVKRIEAYGTPSERETAYAYDANGRLVRQTDALGNVTTFGYDASDRLLTRTSAVGLPEERTESFEYDAKGRLVAQVDGEGERTEFAYDKRGNQTRITVAPGTGAERVLGFEYDAQDRLVAEIDGEGHRTEYRYDAAGNKLETIQALGIEGEERHTLYGYSKDGRLTSVTDPVGHARAHSDAGEFQAWRTAHGYAALAADLSQADVEAILATRTTRYEYDDVGNQFRITDADGGATENEFDEDGRIVGNVVGVGGQRGGIRTENEYDSLGNLVRTTRSWADGTDARTTTYAYDALGRQILVTDGEGFSTRIEYDEFGNQTSVTTGLYLLESGDGGFDPEKAARARPQTTHFEYDELDRLVRTLDGRGNAVESSYDALGNRITQTSGISGGADPAHASTVRFEYDRANRVTAKLSPEGGVVEVEYDEAGNQTGIRTLQSGARGAADAVWVEQRFRYDGNGRVIEETDAFGTKTEYRYDAVGNQVALVRAKGVAGQERSFLSRYDLANHKVAEADPLGAALGYETTYEVDAFGNRTSQTDAEGNVTRLFYDEFHRLVGWVDPEGFLVELVLDSAGNVVETRTYMQELASVPTGGSLPAPPPGDVRIERESWDGAGRRVRREFADESHETFLWDSAGLLLEQTTHPSSDPAAQARTADLTPRRLVWEWDASGRLVAFSNADGTRESYAYDAAGNRIRETVQNPNPLPDGRIDPDRTTEFAYDLDNRLLAQTNGPRVQSFAYDEAGNVVAKTDAGATTTSAYDRNNRVVSITDPLGNTIAYGYDLVGNQTSVRDARGKTTDLVYDLNDRLVEQMGPALDSYTIDGGFATLRPTTTTSYDRLGNVVQIEDARGFQTTRWYDGNRRLIAQLDGDFVLRRFTYDATGAVLTVTRHEDRIAEPMAGDPDPREQSLPPVGTADVVTVTTRYDAMGRPVETQYPEILVTTLAGTDTSNPTSSTSAVAPVERSFYDAFGKLVESTDRNGNRTVAYYDVLGRQVALVDPEGYLVETAFDSQGNVVQQRKYANALDPGALSPNAPPAAPGGDVFVVDRVYDDSGRLVSETSPTVRTESGDVRVETTFGYDAAGNQTSKTRAAGTPDAATEYSYYDAGNRLRAIVTANRVLNVFDYDANGNLELQKRFIDPVPDGIELATATLATLLASVDENAAGNEATEYAYNELNLLSQETDLMGPGSADDLTRAYFYDAAGNLTRKVDADGFVVQNAYDAAAHITTTISPNGAVSHVEYDTAGLKVRSWIGGEAGHEAPFASNVHASASGGAAPQVSVSWDVAGDGGVSSWVAWDTLSHEIPSGSVPSGAPGTGGVYAFATGADGSGSGQSAAIPVPPATGAIYFRVMTRDAAGNLAWTGEQSVALPPLVTAFSVARAGADFTVEVAFGGAVASPLLVPETGTPVPGSPSGPNSFRFALGPVADPTSFAFHIAWSAGGSSFSTQQGTFLRAPGEHAPLGSEGVVAWPLPGVGGSPVGDTQLIVLDGEALPDDRALRVNESELQVDPQLSAPGVYAYEAFYGTRRAESHEVGVAFNDSQSTSATFVHYLDANGNVTTNPAQATQSVWDRTWQSDGDGLVKTRVSAMLDTAELADVGAAGLRVAWRTAQAGAGFANEATLVAGAAELELAAGASYDLKVFYLDAQGREVIVEWLRVAVPAEAAPEDAGRITVDGTGAPASLVREQPVGSALLFTGRSLAVLASETGGRITAVLQAGDLVVSQVDAGAYSGPVDPGQSSVALDVVETRDDAAGLTHDGLALRTYFTEIEYDRLGAKVASNEDTGLWRRYGVDANGNVVETRLYGTQEAEQQGLAPIVSYKAYDARSLEIADFGPSVAAGRAVTRTSWDYAGRVASVLEPGRSVARVFSYDGVGNLVSEAWAGAGILVGPALRLQQVRSLRYDRLGRGVAETDANGNVRRQVYGSANDADPTRRGRLVEEFIEGLEAETIRYAYDAFGRVTSVTDGLGDTRTLTYDQRGRVIQVVDPIGNATADPGDGITRYSYDGRDHQIWVQDANGDFFGRAYDSLGQLTHEYAFQTRQAAGFVHADPTTLAEAQDAVANPASPFRSVLVDRASEYDFFTNKISETDGAGRKRFFSYGAFGRLVSDAREGGSTATFAYDRFGNQVLETSTTGSRIETSYDDTGRLSEVHDVATRSVASYTYDVAGRRQSESLTIDGALWRNAQYAYYENGWLEQWRDLASDPDLELDYEYDRNGNRLLVSGSGSTSDAYSYDAANRVLTHDGATYTYDAAGRRTSFAPSGGTATTYAYDPNGRVTSASGGASITWSYDGVGNVVEFSNAGKVTRNAFDSNGLNWRTEDQDAHQTTETRFDLSGRTHQTVVTDASDSGNVKTYTYSYSYDADGLQTSISGGGTGSVSGNSTSSYDVNGRLVKLDLGKGAGNERNAIKTFVYDTDDQIISRFDEDGEDDTGPAVTTKFVYALGIPLGEYREGDAANPTLNSGVYTELEQIGTDPAFPDPSVSEVTVQAGDTLRAIADRVYGNPNLWFVIAEANGLTGSEPLRVGQRLLVPNTVENGRLSFETHALYDEGEIVGSKLPSLSSPPPKQPSKCAVIAAIILIVVVAIVAIALTIVTVGAAAPAAAAALGVTATSVAGILVGVAVGAVIGAAIAFAASAATQGILIGFGLQESFDWDAVVSDTVAGAFSGGAAGFGALVNAARAASTAVKVLDVVGETALEVAGEAARQAIANDGRIDQPWAIVLAGAGAGFGALASNAARTTRAAQTVAGKVDDAATALAKAAGKVDDVSKAAKLREFLVGNAADPTFSLARGGKVFRELWVPKFSPILDFLQGGTVRKFEKTKIVRTFEIVDGVRVKHLKEVPRLSVAGTSKLARLRATLQGAARVVKHPREAVPELFQAGKARLRTFLAAQFPNAETFVGFAGAVGVTVAQQFVGSPERKSLFAIRSDLPFEIETGGRVISALPRLTEIGISATGLVLSSKARIVESKAESVFPPLRAPVVSRRFDDRNARSTWTDLHARQHGWVPTRFEDVAAVSTTQVFSAFDLDRAARLETALASNRMVSGQVAEFDPESILAFAERSVGGVGGLADLAPIPPLLLDPLPPDPLSA